MIEFYLTVSLFCVGVHIVMNAPGMIGNEMANFITTYQPEYFTKPLFECLSCMSSVYTFLFWVGYGYKLNGDLIIAMFIVCGLNSIFRVMIKPLYDVD